MFKSLFDSSADLCGAPNPLLTLSKNFGGQTNSATAAQIQSAGIQNGGFSGSAVAPGDLLVQEYLAKVAQHTVPPSTFDMRQLMAQLPPLTMAAGNEIGGKEMLERSWAELGERRNLLASEFLEKQQQDGLAQKWANEYSEENREEMKSGSEKMEAEWQIARTESTWAKDFLEDYEAKTAKAQEVEEEEEPSFYNVYGDWLLEDYERYGPDYNPSDMTIPKFFDYEIAWENAKRAQENYQFLEANPYSGEQNALERAANSLGKGHLADSILHFEAALQREPSNPQIWYSLGLALAENEQDPRAIIALRNCLNLEPQNEKAILALAVSLANESFEHLALQELEKWICVHQNREMPEQSPPSMNMPELDRALFGKVEKEFLEAANRAASSPQMDPELQNALSVLYNLGNDFDRAVDCLQAALSLQPDDPILWNRLGATLANADRSAEAISAYKRALQMAPTYVRARYNLGTACMNLNSFRDAAAHFIAALQIQHSPDQSQIWSRLRSALIRIESAEFGHEVFDALERRDLPRIVQFLQAQGMAME